MAELQDLSITAAANDGRFPEGQQASTLNDGARELEAMLAREFKDRSGLINSSGTGSAYLIQPFRAITAFAAGMRFMFKAHVVNTGAATLQVAALAAKPLRRQGGAALAAGDIAANQLVDVVYNAAEDHFEAVGVRGGATSNHLGTYTVAGLPSSASDGQTAFASNGRRAGETAGNGSGVMCYAVSNTWITTDGGAEVEA